MRGEVQGDDECLLATVADLTNTPLSQVRATALAFTGKSSWTEVCKASPGEVDDLYWQAILYVCDIYDKSKKLSHALIAASSKKAILDAVCLASWVPSRTLPEKGKGAIVLVRVFGLPGAHIVPWENGLAYDTNLSGVGETLDVLRFRYARAGFVIHRVSEVKA